MSTLSNKDCASFGKSMKAVPRIELCAGNKVRIKPPIRYVKYFNGTIGRFLPSRPKKKDDFYLGKIAKLAI